MLTNVMVRRRKGHPQLQLMFIVLSTLVPSYLLGPEVASNFLFSRSVMSKSLRPHGLSTPDFPLTLVFKI